MPPRNLYIINVLIAFILLIPAYGQYNYSIDSVFNKPYAQRSLYFDTVIISQFIEASPGEFQSVMDSIRKRAKAEKEYAVELEVFIGEYEYSDRHHFTDYDEKIRAFEKLLASVDRKKYPEYTAQIMFELGNNYFGKKHNYTLAFENYINAGNIVQQFTTDEFPDKKNILVNIANRYYNFGELDKAKELLHNTQGLPNSWVQRVNYNSHNTLGLIYRAKDKYDSAISCFQKTYKLAIADSNWVWASIALGNIGITYYMSGEYEKAIPLLQNDIDGCLNAGIEAYDNAVNSSTILIDIYNKTGKPDDAAKTIDVVYSIVGKTRDKMKLMAGFYPVVADYYYRVGNYQKACVLKDSAILYKDSLAKRDDIYKLAKVVYKKEIQSHNAELGKLNTEKKLIEYTRNSLIAGVIFVLTITGLAFSRQRLRNRVLRAEKLNAEKDLLNATKQLNSFTDRLHEKNAIIEKSAEELKKLQTLLINSQQQNTNDDVVNQLYASTILTDEEWDEFKQLFEQVHKGFLYRLKEKMPELSPADTRFIVLSKLNMSNKEMAGILGVQPDTIRSYKHRLRKKFDLPDEASIKDIVDSI